MHRVPRESHRWKVDVRGLSSTPNQPRVLSYVGSPKGPVVDFSLAACYVDCMKKFTYHVECTNSGTVDRVTVLTTDHLEALKLLAAVTINGERLINPRLEHTEAPARG